MIGYAALGAAMASFERWVANEDEDLLELLDAAFVALAAGFADRGRAMSDGAALRARRRRCGVATAAGSWSAARRRGWCG